MSKSHKIILYSVLAVAALLRLVSLSAPDFVTDEALNSFRSVGMVDFLSTEFQTTPLEWLDQPVWWLKFSFHDHPILTFLVQNIFFSVLGVGNFSARLPFAVAGVASVFLIFSLVRKLSNEKIALASSALLAVASFHVWISRIGLQESIVIALLLASCVLFLKSLGEQKFWKWFGLLFGLLLLAKYTGLYLVPVVFTYLAIFHRSILKQKKFWIAWLLALVIFTPVIVYNVKLYQTFGHFDLQFSYLLKQDTPNWQELPGKSPQGPVGNFLDIWPTLRNAVSPVFLVLFFVSFLFGLYRFLKFRDKLPAFLVLNIIFLTALFSFIGPGVRFLSMLVPFAAGLVAYLFFWRGNLKRSLLGLFTAFLVFETLFSINSNLLVSPKGSEHWTYTKVITQDSYWGYNELDQYLGKQLDGTVTTLLLQSRRPIVGELIKKNLDKRLRSGKFQEQDTLVIYDTNMNWYPRVWYLNRRALYNAVPLVTADDFLKVLREEGEDFYVKAGFQKFVFIKAEDTFLSTTLGSDQAEVLERLLEDSDLSPQEVYSKRGVLAFKVYEF